MVCMGRLRYPNGKPCKCGCGQPVERIITQDGRDKGWRKYVFGHQPPRPFCDPTVRQKASEKQRLTDPPIGSRRIQKAGEGRYYWLVKTSSSGHRWPLEHRHKMEQRLGRKLLTTEVVHHIDNDSLNNADDNLELTNNRDHMLFHTWGHRPMCSCICPNCGTVSTHFKKGAKFGGRIGNIYGPGQKFEPNEMEFLG